MIDHTFNKPLREVADEIVAMVMQSSFLEDVEVAKKVEDILVDVVTDAIARTIAAAVEATK